MEKQTNIYTALAKAQSEFPNIDLDAEVDFTNKAGKRTHFKYATLSNVLDCVVPVLTKNGITHFNLIEEGKIKTVLYHGESGTTIATESPIQTGGEIKDYGARITYLRRYLLISLIGVSAEEDKDHNDLSNNGKPNASVQQMERALAAIRDNKPNVLEEMISKLNLDADQLRQLVNEENNSAFKQPEDDNQ